MPLANGFGTHCRRCRRAPWTATAPVACRVNEPLFEYTHFLTFTFGATPANLMTARMVVLICDKVIVQLLSWQKKMKKNPVTD